MMSFVELFKTHWRIIYRNHTGLFWMLIMPATIYCGLSILPIEAFVKASIPNITYSTYLLPGMLALIIMQGGIYGLAYWMVDLKSRGVLKRFMVTPVKKSEMIISLLCARVLVMVVQVVVLTAIGVVFFHTQFYYPIPAILLLTLLGGFVFLLIGLLIATFADSYEAAAPITAGVGLPLSFLGNVFYPIGNLPPALEVVARLLPITYLADGFRQVYLFPFSFYNIEKDLLVLIAWVLGLLALVIWRFKLEE